MEQKRVKKITEQFANKRVAVVGDLMLDVYVWGKVTRISPEAPVPVVHVTKKTYTLGGAANVMRNIVSLGGKALAFGIIGVGENGDALLRLMGEEGVSTDNILVSDSYKTIEKQRIVADSQQLARVDYEDVNSVSQEDRNKITDSLIKAIYAKEIDAIIFEDYAKGILTSEMLNRVIEVANSENVIVSLDPHPSSKMNVKGLTLMTPNHLEAFGLSGVYQREITEPVTEDKALEEVAEIMNKDWGVKYLLITLGARGMLLFQEGETPLHIPTKAKEVFDVTGAGDTVIAVNTLALLGGASGFEASVIANSAAGIVVGRIGTSSVTQKELVSQFKS